MVLSIKRPETITFSSTKYYSGSTQVSLSSKVTDTIPLTALVLSKYGVSFLTINSSLSGVSLTTRKHRASVRSMGLPDLVFKENRHCPGFTLFMKNSLAMGLSL